jgi:aspartyl-tRNA(Asn)/glutamyl-tRNA(Gln) amidotransferase subunit C
MSLDIKDVENLAELARIELSGDEKTALLKDFDNILAYVGQIETLKIEGKEEPQVFNVWREDELVLREFSRELVLEQFPDTQEGFLKVKKIL